MVTAAIGVCRLQAEEGGEEEVEEKVSNCRHGTNLGKRGQSSQGRFAVLRAGSTGLGSEPQISLPTRIAQQPASNVAFSHAIALLVVCHAICAREAFPLWHFWPCFDMSPPPALLHTQKPSRLRRSGRINFVIIEITYIYVCTVPSLDSPLWIMDNFMISTQTIKPPVKHALPHGPAACTTSPIVPFVLALLSRRGRRAARGALAHRRRADGAAPGLALVRRRREVVPEGLLALVQRRGPGVDRLVAALRSLDELGEALLCGLGARLRRGGDAAAKGPRLGSKIRFSELQRGRGEGQVSEP